MFTETSLYYGCTKQVGNTCSGINTVNLLSVVGFAVVVGTVYTIIQWVWENW